MLNNLYNSLDTLDDIYNLIDEAIVDDPPMAVKEGGLIKRGFNCFCLLQAPCFPE